MGFLEWEKKYELGIPEMDEQHKKWLSMLNKFYEHLDDEKLVTNLQKILFDAKEYTVFHFQSEEKFMGSIGYNRLEQQHRLHQEMIQKIEELETRLKAGKMVTSLSVTQEFRRWFNEHILIEDKGYGEFYAARQK